MRQSSGQPTTRDLKYIALTILAKDSEVKTEDAHVAEKLRKSDASEIKDKRIRSETKYVMLQELESPNKLLHANEDAALSTNYLKLSKVIILHRTCRKTA